MSSSHISKTRKRLHIRAFRDVNDSEESPRKRRKNGDLPLVLKTKFQQMTEWIRELRYTNGFVRMAFMYGVNFPMRRCQLEEDKSESNSEEEEEEEEDDVKELDDDDDDIQEIKENVYQEQLPSLNKQFKNSFLLSDYGHPKQKLAVNGIYSNSLGSHPNSNKSNEARELSTRYHGTTNCKLRREKTEKLKRRALFSNHAPTEFEIFVGLRSDGVPLEGNGIEVLSESPRSKIKHTTPQKAFSISAVKSPSLFKQKDQLPKLDSSLSKVYTANEVVRLQERDQYKLLLEKYVNGTPLYQSLREKPESDLATKDNKGIMSVRHFKKEVLQQPIASFVEKYCRPCQLLPPKDKAEPPTEITIDDDEEEEEKKKVDEDSDVQIVDMKLPQYKVQYKSPLFTKHWLLELKEHVRVATAERNEIVKDYERQLEKIKKSRILRELRGDVVSIPAKPVFPELTPEMEDIVDKILNTGELEDFICKTCGQDSLYRKDFDTLSGLKWLNDAIINSYFDLIVERSKKDGFPSVYAYNTFFFCTLKSKGYSSVRRWTRKVDIFSFDINFVPIHSGCHWCLAVIDHRSRKISYYDSMGTAEEGCLITLLEYLCNEYKDKKGETLNPLSYAAETLKDIPQQLNGSDCGMFTIKFAEYIAREAEIDFTQQQMQYFRRRTVYELYTSQFL